ncbi:MAG: acetoin:2,6-dichlorophenolindophenol oxidoreductase subunit alpha [Chloroflexota bacterium]|jgi:pyruvate dehydrogenase E1 component alpha subunit|nr:acetoin:2,6-dichlorophenolindophenol oxidoreductase subunit alpha [Chloroflexota bacterium]
MTQEEIALGSQATGTTSPPADLDRRIALYEMQFRLRTFERRAHELFIEGLVRGTSHLATGQEAISSGFASAMRPDDYTFCTYRGHNHVISRGASMAGVMGELMGRGGGLMGGKGGSMHLISVEHGAMGSYAIVGAHLPVAAGAAWSAQMRKSGQVAVCFFGDGTTNIGAFHEALNLAAVWKLPVVFVCENNQYMEYTPIGTVTAVEHPAADRAAAYGLEAILIDGNDVDVVHATAVAAITRARNGEGPSLIEAETYRHGGHSRADPATYRPAEEVERWLARDPVVTYRKRLLDEGVDAARIEAIEAAELATVEAAIDEARAMPQPNEDRVATNVWADGGASWRN